MRTSTAPLLAALLLVGSLSACSGGSTTADATAGSRTAVAPTTQTTTAPTALDGRWVVDGDVRAAITFHDGSWTATTSCTSGALGGAGRYEVLPGGRLHVVRTMAPVRGCPVVDGPLLGKASAITQVERAASFRVEGGTLTLFETSGAPLGSLVRG